VFTQALALSNQRDPLGELTWQVQSLGNFGAFVFYSHRLPYQLEIIADLSDLTRYQHLSVTITRQAIYYLKKPDYLGVRQSIKRFSNLSDSNLSYL